MLLERFALLKEKGCDVLSIFRVFAEWKENNKPRGVENF
jgi:hypothetical protein